MVSVLLLGGWAHAQFSYLSYRMLSTQQSPFIIYVDSRSQTPAGLSYTLMQNAVEKAWNTWNAVSCAYPKVRSLGATSGTVPDPSDTFDAFSVMPVWLFQGDPDLLEVFGNSPNLITAMSLPRSSAGVLQTCDVFFNGPGIGWTVDPVTPPNRLDVETAMLHEAGHCLGLGHFGLFDEVMYGVVEPGESLRVLTTQDTAALCNRYPLAGEYASPCTADGGCNSSLLKCLPQPETNGISMSLCTKGCGLTTGGGCDIPLSCQGSSDFAGFNGACKLPGNIVTAVGKSCTAAAECGNSFGTCQRPVASPSQNGVWWQDGYCTQNCAAGQPVCPAGSTCIEFGPGEPLCVQDCRVGLADCRPGYACQQVDEIGTTGICIPRCYSNADCGLDFQCRTCDGICVPLQNPSGAIGDLCLTEDTCGAGQVCRITSDRSGLKQCTQQCSRACGTCPSGNTCTPGPRGELFCFKDCTGPGTCPLGLRCADTAVGKGCIPGCSANSDCPVGQDCFNGECYNPMEGDGGCSTLSCRPDAGRPIVITRDAGTGGTGGTGGCGCASVDPAFGLGLLAMLSLASRRRSWRAQR